MNFTSLSTQTMLAHSRRLTTLPEPRAILAGHPMGSPTLDELAAAHVDLAEVVGAREYTLSEIGRLKKLIETLDFTHDECARAVFYGLEALSHDPSDPEQAALYRQAQRRLFPDGLEIVKRSYSDQSGAVVQRRAQMTHQLRQLLDSTTLGVHTLGALFDSWNLAGQELGEAFLQRGQLQVGLSSGGTLQIATNHRAKRNRWIRAMRALLIVIEVMQLGSEEREVLLGTLQQSIDNAELRRARSAQQTGDDDGDDGAPDGGVDGDDAAVDDVDVDDVDVDDVDVDDCDSASPDVSGDQSGDIADMEALA